MLFQNDIALASDGDSAAIAAVADRLRPRLTKMAAWYARNTGEDADDLLQEAYVGLLEALTRVDLSIGDPEQYLLKHARWRLLDAAKRWRRRRCEALDDDRTDLHPTTDFESEISEMWVDDFAEQLKPTQRAILRYLLIGMTWREAGDGLGCTSANVAYHVRQIQKTYERWTGEPVSNRTSAEPTKPATPVKQNEVLTYGPVMIPASFRLSIRPWSDRPDRVETPVVDMTESTTGRRVWCVREAV